MKRNEFFLKQASQIKHEELVSSFEENNIEVLTAKYQWVSKINEDEINRYEGFRKKAEILLGFHIGFATLLLSNVIYIFPRFTSKLTLFSVFLLIIIFGSILLGIYYSLRVCAVPRFRHFLDISLVLNPHKSEERWIKEAIAEIMIVYKNNLDIISSYSFRTLLSFDFLIISLIATIISFMITNIIILNENTINLNKCFIFGGMLGVLSLFLLRYGIEKLDEIYKK